MSQLKTLALSCLLLFLFALSGNAQERGNWQNRPAGGPKAFVKGKVVDEESQAPLEYATISLISMRDSSIITGGITDAEGKFSIETRPGRMMARIEYIAYEPIEIGGIKLGKEQMEADLGIISLRPSAAVLAEVEVRAEKSEMQFTLDKKVFNVGKDLATTSSSAAELLDNVPSVQVDIEGGVSLRGSENVRILIDGKPSGMIGVGDADGLRQIPANLVDKVEVITNPSARYEAEGTTGIINLVLRKEKKTGLNGSFDFTVGHPLQLGTAINLNYRQKKFNLFLNYGISHREGPGEGSRYQEFLRGDTLFISQQERRMDRKGFSNSVRFGSDFFLDDKNTLTTSFTYRISDDDNFTNINYQDFIDVYPDNFVLQTKRTDQEREDEEDLTFAVNWRRTFDKKGHQLTADFQYETSGEVEGSAFVEKYYDAEGVSTGAADQLQRSKNDEGNSEYLIKMDYVHPFSKEGKFEAGYRGSLRQIRNDYLVEEFDDVRWFPLAGLSNNFIYDENIHGVYLIYGNKHNKFSYQGGLRMEYTDVVTELEQTEEINPRDYFNFFPSVSLTYDLPDKNAIQASYSRRITRPRFWYLNPFFHFSDDRNFFSGNPNLDPEFTNSYELGHIKYFGKGSLSSSLYYRHTTDKIQRIQQVNEDGTTATAPQNLLTEDAFGLEFNFAYSPAKWLRTNGDFNFFRSIIDGENIGSSFEADTYTWFTRLSTKFTTFKKLDTQIRFNYRAPRESTQGNYKSMYSVDLGMSMDILKGKGTLTLSGRDIFNSRKRRWVTELPNFYSEGKFQWRARSITLTLNYRLNQKKKRGGGRRNFEGGGEGMF